MSRILIVDDEEHVLNALRRLLSHAAREIKVDLFSAPEEALNKARHTRRMTSHFPTTGCPG